MSTLIRPARRADNAGYAARHEISGECPEEHIFPRSIARNIDYPGREFCERFFVAAFKRRRAGANPGGGRRCAAVWKTAPGFLALRDAGLSENGRRTPGTRALLQ